MTDEKYIKRCVGCDAELTQYHVGDYTKDDPGDDRKPQPFWWCKNQDCKRWGVLTAVMILDPVVKKDG